jgi:negative regulator of flagellin synthesis FlgM
MKVDLSSLASIQDVSSKSTKPSTTATSTTSTSTVSEDRTTLSSDSASVQSLVAKVLAFPSVRQDKIDALRQSINAGSYKIDADKVATALATSGE